MSFSIVNQLEAKRAAPSSLVGRLCASAAALAAHDAQSVGRWQRSVEGGWLVYTAAKRRHRLAVSAAAGV